MGKRSDMERVPQDFYVTPPDGILPLLPHLPRAPFTFFEPCVGDGAIINHLSVLRPDAECVGASDIVSRTSDHDVEYADFTKEYPVGAAMADLIITNSPWDRPIMHAMIENVMSHVTPAWMLLDSNWAATEQANKYLKGCEKIVHIGRLKWIPGTKDTGKDDCSFYHFNPCYQGYPTVYPRMTRAEKKAAQEGYVVAAG